MPTLSAPAAVAASAAGPWAKTATRTVLPVPLGITVAPRTTWSDLRGSTPRLIATSTDSLNLTVDSSLSRLAASSKGYCLPCSTLAAIACLRFESFIIGPPHSSPCCALSQQWYVQQLLARLQSDQLL